ncbi:Striatin-interacting 1 [Lecanosticta acicola]|uniref:Striatin-interacting 1 n=1 Tax=Lecanosticta acicola TaxID=111012 RepID=A0AAI8YTI2_9PEZI|nr:Striatin-interacting 1 [Lecanosticta acicola]
MDEVENPALPAAGETSPTIRPIDPDEVARIEVQEVVEPGIDTAEAEALVNSAQDEDAKPTLPASRAPPNRPPLKRDNSNPSPSQPPPAPPAQPAETNEFPQDPPDSLTLADLKRIRNSFPNAQAPGKQQLLGNEKVYDFEYQDAQSFPVELEEWFSYSEEEESKLRRCKAVFNDEWRSTEEGKFDWLDVTEDARRAFVKKWIGVLKVKPTEQEVTKALTILTYVGLGIWEQTAGRREGCALEDLFPDCKLGGSRLEEYGSSSLQVQWMVAMVDTLHACDGLGTIYDTLRRVFDNDFANSAPELPSRNESQIRRGDESMELWCCLTLMYLFVEVARSTANGQTLKGDILALEPKFLNYLTQIVAKLRWDESAPIPLTKMLLLAWKTILVSFGGINDIENVKAALQEKQDVEMDARGEPIITASPLDYHLFRQEISSKYPAYQPPPPLFPLEPENNSILPPLKHRRPSYAAPDPVFAGAPTVGTGSIMHQPVHIATPAPSPPPSPAGPGKAGKKQNYQTNQMFPFLYPPLDASSNDLGGKGSTELQDALVGRKWEGSDVPTSILEATELFAKRMRATRAMTQLWEARVDFMKQERGWKNPDDDDQNPDVADFELLPQSAPKESAEQGKPIAQTDEERRVSKVKQYYRESLPHLQSVVIVLLKAVLQNVTDLVTKGNGQNGLQAGIQFNEANGVNGTKPMENGVHSNGDGIENTAEELDRLRSQEISAKALSAMLILLLKWFKISHILQYEYMTQLLLDSNYVPLILKLWQTQEIGRGVHYRLDREEKNFFYFCQTNSRNGLPKSDDGEANASQSEDEAAPPPIRRHRDEPTERTLSPGLDSSDFTHPPEVDELGYPQTQLPPTPLKNYSYRNLFSAINYLRVLQKVTHRKTHRALLLVSYKSSNHLKKTLKIPVQMLRYYTLKLFKSQVPFCGRKWRQGNMKIITAVWLSVPAELRDDWLSGGGGGMGGACVGDVDGTVEDALPLEQSLRALTHWWNVRNYPDVMGVDKAIMEDEMDYFTRELEKMEFVREEMEMVEGENLGDEWQGPIEGY